MDHDYMAEKSSSETRVEETNLNFRKHFDGKAAERAKKNWHWGKMKREKFPHMIYASFTLNTVSGFCFEWCWQHLCKLDLLRWLPLMATIQTLQNSNNPPRPRILGIGAFSSHTKCSPLLRLRHYLWRLSIVGMFIFCHSLQFNANKSKRIGGNENLESWINLVLIESLNIFLKLAWHIWLVTCNFLVQLECS